MDKIIEYIKQLFSNNVLEIRCISRLFHKNLVFYIHTQSNKKFAFKLFFNGNDRKERYFTENNIYHYLKNNEIVNVPNVIKNFETEFGNALIIEWVNGISIKSKLANLGLSYTINDIKEMINDLEKIWKIDDREILSILVVDKIGLNYRVKESENQIFEKIKKLKPEIDFQKIIELYFELKNKVKLENLKVINSDVSAHEFILANDKNYWLDFERYRLGDPNNDLARCFYSLASVIYKNDEEVNYLFEMFKNSQYFQPDIFLYYFIEKILNNIYVAPEQTNTNEINYFINYSILLYNTFLKNNLKI